MTQILEDDALMAATARGEEAAFRLLVQRWEGQVKAFLIHMLGSVEEAEDLAQDTFVQVFNKAGGYHPEGRFQSWLFRIAGNYARSRLRRRKILGWVSFNPEVHDRFGGSTDPGQELEAADTIEYAEVRSVPDLASGTLVSGRTLLAVAARVGPARLIDNFVVDVTESGITDGFLLGQAEQYISLRRAR